MSTPLRPPAAPPRGRQLLLGLVPLLVLGAGSRRPRRAAGDARAPLDRATAVGRATVVPPASAPDGRGVRPLAPTAARRGPAVLALPRAATVAPGTELDRRSTPHSPPAHRGARRW